MAHQVEAKAPATRTTRTKAVQEPVQTRKRTGSTSGGYEQQAEALRPRPTPQAGPIQLSPRNSQARGEDHPDLPAEVAQSLRRKGYLVYPANSLNVLNETASQKPDAPIERQKVGQGGYSVVTSGTFYFNSRGQKVPAGAVMRDGKLDTPGVPKAAQRGGIAILKDGSIVLGRMDGGNQADIQRRFGQPGNEVSDFLGGGALLVEDGKSVSSRDLLERQKFDQGAGGIEAQQMRKTDHVVVAVREGRCFVIVAKNKTGKEIQSDLAAAGFGTVVKLDGGSGGYARDTSGVRAGGVNPTGLGVK